MTVSLGAGTVVHPNAQIIAEAGPIIIGDNNLIEEQALIINRQDVQADMAISVNYTDNNSHKTSIKVTVLRLRHHVLHILLKRTTK